MGKDLPCKNKQKDASVSILMSDKVNFKTRKFTEFGRDILP